MNELIFINKWKQKQPFYHAEEFCNDITSLLSENKAHVNWPSDEEIHEVLKPYYREESEYKFNVGLIQGAKLIRDNYMKKNMQESKEQDIEMGKGKCLEKNCTRFAVIDYNGCGHWVCRSHYDSLITYFDEEYK